MDKRRVMGKVDDAVGRAKRQVKEWITGRASAVKPGKELKLHKDSEALEDPTKAGRVG